MAALEHLAQLGFRVVLDLAPHAIDDAAEITPQLHSIVRDRLVTARVNPSPHGLGAAYLIRISWPDRVPGLVTWSGNQTLAGLITARQIAIRESEERDLYAMRVPMTGASGLDLSAAHDAIDVGWSPNRLHTQIAQRPAVELLAIIGLETVPLVSFGYRDCGYIHGGQIHRIHVQPREGGYYHRWSDLTA